MIITIQRLLQAHKVKKPDSQKPAEDATIGVLTVLDKDTPLLVTITVENGGLDSAEANKDKRIMAGTYHLQKTSTTVPLPREYKFRGLLLVNTEDPSFSKRRILIHAGNYPQDTEGCVLLQSMYDFIANPGYGHGSMRATKAFYDLIYKDAESHTLIIKNSNGI